MVLLYNNAGFCIRINVLRHHTAPECTLQQTAQKALVIHARDEWAFLIGGAMGVGLVRQVDRLLYYQHGIST
jgi:hypothetical protein